MLLGTISVGMSLTDPNLQSHDCVLSVAKKLKRMSSNRIISLFIMKYVLNILIGHSIGYLFNQKIMLLQHFLSDRLLFALRKDAYQKERVLGV